MSGWGSEDTGGKEPRTPKWLAVLAVVVLIAVFVYCTVLA
jgi:hypothetical protein